MSKDLSEKSKQETITLKMACAQSVSTPQRTAYGVETTTTYSMKSVISPFDRPEKGTAVCLLKCPVCGKEFPMKVKSLNLNRLRKLISLGIFLVSIILFIVLITNDNIDHKSESVQTLAALTLLSTIIIIPVSFFLVIFYNFNIIHKRGLSIKFPDGHKLMRGQFFVS
jgi:hypothetical protein